MFKRVFSAVFLIFVIVFSIGVAQASDADVTDLNMSRSSDDANLQIENNDCGSLSDFHEDYLSGTAKNTTELTSQTSGIYYKGSYNVILKDLNSSSLLGDKEIAISINDVDYGSKTDSNGVASFKLDLAPGRYVVNANFLGDDSYENCTLSATLDIQSTVKANDITKYYKGTTPFTAQFFDSLGNPLANRMVSVNVAGNEHVQNTDANGFVNIAVDLKPGTYEIISTDPVTGYRLISKFVILSTISSSNVNQVEGQGKRFTVKFFNSNGQALAKKYVKYKIKGKTHRAKTNSYGQVSLSLKKFKKGTYKIVCYNKDGLSKTYKIKIYKRKASTRLNTEFYTLLPGDAKEIGVRLSTALGDSSNSGKTIKIRIDGKTYSRKTDGEGIARLQMPSLKNGFYKVEYSYGGSKFFKASKATNYVTVLGTSDTSLTVKGTKSFGYGAGTLFKLALTAGNVPLVKKTVNLNVDGKTYFLTTDGKGMVYLPINLKIGKYDVNYMFQGDSKLNGTSGNCEIEVFKRSDSRLTWKCATTYKDSSQTFKVLLTDLNGNPVSRGTVKLTLASKTYTATTSSNGYATVKTSVELGKYKVSAEFIGNNEHLSSKVVKPIEVKLSKFRNGINEKSASASSAYLKSSSHCKVGNAKIKAKVKSLTKGLKSKVDKAKAIFNFVRDDIKYSFYYDTKYGSSGTLKAKKGNCVDSAHLLVCMLRTAGFKARYVHGVCKFNSGHVYGHVWAQVHIGKYWICGDASDDSNSLGRIANWNTKTCRIHAKYSSLPF
ncbi:transglutaminase domain-containing protein [Methanobrevibacter sp.]|uniref:transglutaminase domain-containing protein n=1 Tax=Methanobrevibacter sp. TaxID=66852 RepID=UPI0038690465